MPTSVSITSPFLHPTRMFPLAMIASVAFGLCVSSACTANHPFHICVGEMEWNAERGIWEIGLRLHPSDLQASYKRVQKADWPEATRDTVDGKSKIEAFLQTQFVLESVVAEKESTQDGKGDEKREVPEKNGEDGHSKGQLKLIGMEDERGWVWLFLEVVPPESNRPLQLQHRLLLEDVEGQENLLLVRKGKERKSLRFDKESPVQLLPFSDQK